MTVFFDKDRGYWRYDFRYKKERYHGPCVDKATSQHARNKTEAKHIEDAIRVSIRNHPESKAGAPRGYSYAQAFATYLKTLTGRGGFKSARDHIAEFLQRPQFRPERLITETSDKDIQDYIDWARQQPVMIYLGGPAKKGDVRTGRELYKALDRKRSDASINRYLDTLRAVYKLAHKMRDGTGERLMKDLIDVPKLKTKKRMPRPMPLSLAQQVMAEAPPHLADAIDLTTAFGFRRAEVFGLTDDQVDFEANGIWLDGDHVKENRDNFLPASPATMAKLRKLVDRAQAAGQKHLILYLDPRTKKLRPIKKPGAAWARLRKKTGRHTFHNIRGTFVQRLVKEKVDPRVTQKLARHSRPDVTQAYYDIEDAMRRAAVEAMDARLQHGQAANDNLLPEPDQDAGTA